MDTKDIEELIRRGLPEATVIDVRDPRNDRTHFEATIVSPSFEGLSRIQQHKLVYKALGNSFDGPLHALQMTTAAPSQYNP
jgi:stress-induced morphogen